MGEIGPVGGSVTPEPLRRGGWVGLGDSPQSAMVGSSVRLQVCIFLSTISIQTHGITARLSFRRVRTRRLVQNSLYEPADSSGGSRTVWLETRISRVIPGLNGECRSVCSDSFWHANWALHAVVAIGTSRMNQCHESRTQKFIKTQETKLNN